MLGLEADPDNAPFIIRWTEARHLEAMSDPDRGHLVIETRDSGEAAGYVILSAIQSVHRSVELNRITVARKGEGLGREGLRAVRWLAFERLNAHRLWLDVMAHNDRAASLCRSEGFVEEGTLRDALEKDGRRVSLIVLSMLVHEYAQGRARGG